ncbi:fungal specific transcription factor [Penicillium macrosclerotiorum]|uniref:fungal specific transcription factor n=1 Tax=Penicillium macrosclerotiorum TaxID=303699 RepID=UPI002546E598|nr:fungal specific transcription factor [Penicillium macrosclerotiorum]KAJ5679470.1 fungal specific transcription factor [Penicillium macrosclerotiorum]
MRVSINIMLVAIVSAFLSTLCQQTMGRLFPISINPISNYFYRRPGIGNVPDDWASCSRFPPLSTTERTEFDRGGCMVYGYPSTGGVLAKEANLHDMLFLSLRRSHESQRSPNADEEDRFCNVMRRTGATWWSSKEDRLEALMGAREMTEEEEREVVFGWPTDGVGVWVLRFESARQLPRDFGKISFAMNMEEKIQIMREYGATFVEDSTQVDELREACV